MKNSKRRNRESERARESKRERERERERKRIQRGEMPITSESWKLFYESRYSSDRSCLACLLPRPVFVFIKVCSAVDPCCNIN